MRVTDGEPAVGPLDQQQLRAGSSGRRGLRRELCATEPGYFGLLSAESVRTLALQGGPMTPEQAAAFGALPHAHDAVAVRRWDDEAKDPAVTPPPFAHFEDLLKALLKPGPLSSEACGRAR